MIVAHHYLDTSTHESSRIVSLSLLVVLKSFHPTPFRTLQLRLCGIHQLNQKLQVIQMKGLTRLHGAVQCNSATRRSHLRISEYFSQKKSEKKGGYRISSKSIQAIHALTPPLPHRIYRPESRSTEKKNTLFSTLQTTSTREFSYRLCWLGSQASGPVEVYTIRSFVFTSQAAHISCLLPIICPDVFNRSASVGTKLQRKEREMYETNKQP